ncbi:multicopper oxidase domain-containing protein, partial [Streptomyces sp. IF17]|nr:multicopper oxidase domain-containing protein [Streptomyces alkaliphilus]
MPREPPVTSAQRRSCMSIPLRCGTPVAGAPGVVSITERPQGGLDSRRTRTRARTLSGMVENLFEQNVLWAVLTAVLWGFAAHGARRLALRPAARLPRRVGMGLALLGVALVALLLRVASALALALAAGWSAAVDYVLFGAVPLVPTGAAVLLMAVPAYRRTGRVARRSRVSGEDATDLGAAAALRRSAADPRLVVPVWACALAAVAGAILTLRPPAPPHTGLFLLHSAFLLVGTVCLYLWQVRRREAQVHPGRRPRALSVRLARLAAGVAVLVLVPVGVFSFAAENSRLPARAGHHGHVHDTGGGPGPGGAPHRDVSRLTGPRTATPDRTITLTAAEETLRLASGETVAALAFNGRLPGPELRVRRGELVEVVLVNKNVGGGVTLHWHGVDVPNAEDGVAGVTQDAVPPGGRHVYRFRPDRAGTFWYHSHQQPAVSVARGLFGALIVEEPEPEPEPAPPGLDLAVVAHAWSVGEGDGPAGPPRGGALSGNNGLGGELRTAFGDSTRERWREVPAGTPVRLRLVNADNCPRTFSLTGTGFEVAAIDGNEVPGATELRDTLLRVAGGGRYDLTFRQPDSPVRLGVVGDANVRG